MGNQTGAPAASPSEAIESQFEQLLDALPVAAYTCDRSGLITYFNARAAELWGRTPKLRDASDRWCGSFRLFDAQDGAPIAHDPRWMALAIQHGPPSEGHELIIEPPARISDTLVDITDRKRTEETNSRLGALVESPDDAIIGNTLEGRIVSWNAAAERIFG